MVPTRTHFSTILSEIKSLNSKIDLLTQNLPAIIQSELHHFNDRRSLTIYGLPEDSTTKKKVNSIFNLVSISSSNVSILHRLGKPRQDGLPRPLKVSIKDGIPFPRLIDLSTAMKSEDSMSTFHVRKFETPEQRKAGFLARQSKRDAARAEVTDQTTILPSPADTNLQTEMEVVEESRSSVIITSLSATCDSPQAISSEHNTCPTPSESPPTDDPISIPASGSFDNFYKHHVPPTLYPSQLERIARYCKEVHSHCEQFPNASVEDYYVFVVPPYFRTTFIIKYYELYDYKIIPASRMKNLYM